MIRKLSLAAVGVAMLLAGCQTGLLPDPNDPSDGPLDPEVLQANLRSVSDNLMQRVGRREINDRQYRLLMAEYAASLVGKAQIDKVASNDAWRYADVLRTARRFDLAEPMLRSAIKWAKTQKNEDRIVNDTLRLSEALCYLNRVDEGLKVAREAFDADPKNKAPIITAVLLEIAPAARGKQHDVEVAKLLEDAIDQSLQTVVDTQSEAGKAFDQARPYHIHKARELAIQLYVDGGKSDLAEAAQKRMAKDPDMPKPII